MVMGATKAATPTINSVLKMLLPTTLPTAKSEVPFKADTRLMHNSGMEVPKATMVRPMTIWGMRSRRAMDTAPSVMRSAPHKTSAMPAMMMMMSNANSI